MPNELPKNFEEFADARRAGFLKMKEVKDQGKQVCGCSVSIPRQKSSMQPA